MKSVRVDLSIAGLGIVIVDAQELRISPGDDFFSANLADALGVVRTFSAHFITGFATGSPGSYSVWLQTGHPTEESTAVYPMRLRLPFRCCSGEIQLRDLYDFMSWDPSPAHDVIVLDPGSYILYVFSRRPESGIIGDDQEILICIDKCDDLAPYVLSGIPVLREL